MENKRNILDGLRKSEKPLVPEGFYDQFWTDLMQRIQNESGILGQLKKSEKPSVPEDFFSKLTVSLDSINEESILDKAIKAEKPSLPAGYFDQSVDCVMTAVKEVQTNKKRTGRIINMRTIRIMSLVAAAIAIIFTVVQFSSNSEKDDQALLLPIESQQEIELMPEDSYDDYLVYLDEDEIIDYIIENNIEIEDTADVFDFDDYSEFSEEDIEEYYLDLL